MRSWLLALLPVAVTVDRDGNVWVVDKAADVLLKIEPL